jgi:hypothetical protein
LTGLAGLASLLDLAHLAGLLGLLGLAHLVVLTLRSRYCFVSRKSTGPFNQKFLLAIPIVPLRFLSVAALSAYTIDAIFQP